MCHETSEYVFILLIRSLNIVCKAALSCLKRSLGFLILFPVVCTRRLQSLVELFFFDNLDVDATIGHERHRNLKIAKILTLLRHLIVKVNVLMQFISDLNGTRLMF